MGGVLERAKYNGHFFQKIKTQSFRFNGRSSDKGGGHDGAAVFWNTEKFTFVRAEAFLINSKEGEFNKQVCGRVVLRRKDGQMFAVYAAHMKSGKAKDKDEKEC